jgi:hypothetical protein
MIGVLANDGDHSVVAEFFELFKTPWDFYRENVGYDVLICSSAPPSKSFARLVLVYGTEQRTFDRQNGITKLSQTNNAVLLYKQDRIPLYGECITFKGEGRATLVDDRSGDPAVLELNSRPQNFIRLGFDLFDEIRHLITHYQPCSHAPIPTLELHIALLRDLILTHGIPLVEIPPIPAGYKFVACLTHDVDHLGIRNHRLDHTAFGFLWRALIGSLINFCRGRRTLKQVAANWMAAFSLPFVYLGLVKDFWNQLEAYIELEKGLNSTFFLIPKKGDPGSMATGSAPKGRAAQYEVGQVGEQLRRLISARREIALHGIDAWRDAITGHGELEMIQRASGEREIGVRMHWLFFDEHSPAKLEEAGFAYDSTVGYNDTVGYRAGTTQVFKPLQVQRLLELPLHLMDTALFFPGRMNLSPKAARDVSGNLVKNAVRFGGALTINWHDRSIAPERLWDGWYVELLDELKKNEAWFGNAAETVAWFRRRRSAVIDTASSDEKAIRLNVTLDESRDDLPGLTLRVHHRSAGDSKSQLTEISLNRSEQLEVALGRSEAIV